MWRRWRIISTLVLPSITDWTGDLTLKLFTRKGWADFPSWGSWDPSTCGARCWKSFNSLWWPVYFSLLWFVGEAALEPATPTDSSNSLRRLALWLVVNRTPHWWRGGHWTNCYPSWIILSLSTSHWSDSGAPSPKGCFSFAVLTTDTGTLSCHKSSLHTKLSQLMSPSCLHLHFFFFLKSFYLFILPVVLLLHTHLLLHIHKYMLVLLLHINIHCLLIV